MLRAAAPLLLAGIFSLDFAHKSSVDAFAPGVLRGSLARDRCPSAACRAPQVARFSPANRNSRCALLQTKAIFGGGGEEIDRDLKVATHFPTAERLIAIGDVHGDVKALAGCLKLSGLMDDDESWIGGKAHLVQLGDLLDRGDTERNCMDLLFKLREQAAEAGGMVHMLLGNHEVMNVDLDFRYVTQNAWEGWGDAPKSGSMRLDIKASLAAVGFPAYMKQRVQAFRPGGVEARRLSKMPIAIMVGDTLLVHGGLRKKHLVYGMQRMNQEMAAWLHGPPQFKAIEKPDIIDDSDSPIWARLYSVPTPKDNASRELEDVLKELGAKRMVVGHTPQLRGINAFVTDGGYEVWRTDTGMSSGMMSGPLEALEVLPDGTVHVLTEKGVVPAVLRMPEAEGEFMDVCDIDTGLCTDAPEDSAQIKMSNLADNSADRQQDQFKVRPGEELVTVIAPSQTPFGSLSQENQAEVELLRSFDDKAAPLDMRLTQLVERLIVDAIQRQDEGLTKKTVKDMLKKVVGNRIVDDNSDYISAEVDRIISSDVATLVAKYMFANKTTSAAGAPRT